MFSKHLPEVMVSKDERPVVKAKKGNAGIRHAAAHREAAGGAMFTRHVKQLPGVVEMNDNLSLGGQGNDDHSERQR
jgi:hypothetical protein